MNRCVLDASVIATAFFNEEFEEHATALLASDCSHLAPELIVSEVGNVIWKRFRRGEISEAEADQLLVDFLRLDFIVFPFVSPWFFRFPKAKPMGSYGKIMEKRV